MIDFRDVLTFESEHALNAEPLKMDVLVIKKPADAVITKNIGAIFKTVNIVEFKSRADSMSVAKFHRVCAYVHLYLAINRIPVTDVTMSIILASYPRALMKYFTKSCGYTITEASPGVYVVNGNIFPMQVVGIKRLPQSENLWLVGLSDEVDADGMEQILQAQIEFNDRINLAAYINVIAEANPNILKEVLNMSTTKTTLRQVLIDVGLTEEAKNQGKAEGKIEGKAEGKAEGKIEGKAEEKVNIAKNMLGDGLAPEIVVKYTGLPLDYVKAIFNEQ